MNITTGKGDIRVAIVGVGNCANSLVQGVTYYKDAALDQEIPGLMHATIGSYHISNVKFVAAFDVDAKKVGLDLAMPFGQVKTTPSSLVMLLRLVFQFFAVLQMMVLVSITAKQLLNQMHQQLM